MDPSEEARHVVAVLPGAEGGRLDRLIAAAVPGISRMRVQALIAEGRVTTPPPGAATIREPSYRVKPGQAFVLSVPRASPAGLPAQALPLDILFEDADLIVVDKPAGLVVHPAPGNPDRTLVNALLAHCGEDLLGVGGVGRPGIVHRLDKDTSGLLVVAKHDRAHAGLAAQIQAKDALRQYWAVVRGHLDPQEGRIEAPIARHPVQRQKMAVVPGGRHAATRWKVLESFKGYDLVELTLETGRTHQIRVHLAHLGHPVVGDPAYGGEVKLPVKLAGQALHARRLAFTHPVTGEALSFEAEPPETFRKLLAYLR
jgi:23S rRNA pseudouridine1911/1915/1917 synthase